MNRRNLQFNALRAFEAAARHNSVTGAAEELGVTHSAVSHQLKQLETQLDTRLFERTNRGLKITVEGSRLLPVLIESFDRISNALNEFRQSDDQGVIRVTCTPTFAAKWLVSRLSDWYASPDACRIHLQPSLEFLDFAGDNLDLAIRCGVPPWEGLEHELLLPIHLVPVCSPEYARQHKLPAEPVAVLEHDLIHADVGDHGPGEEWRDWLTGCNVQATQNLPGLAVHDPALAMQAAADGLGLAIGYREFIERDLQAGHLLCASQQLVKHEYSYYLVYRKGQPNQVALNQFKNWLIDQQ